MSSLSSLLATNARAKEIYLTNCELLRQGKLPPCIKVIKAGQGETLKKRKRNNPPPPSNKAKKIKLIDLEGAEDAPVVDLTSDSEEVIEVINLE